MKKLLALFLALVLCLSLAACSSAESSSGNAAAYPGGKTITMMCPWSAGGGSDSCVRLLVPYLEEELGATITVINPTGGSGWVAWEQLLNGKADGLTITQVNWPTLMPGYLDPSFGRDYGLDDFQLLANQVTDNNVIAINKDETRFTTAEEFFEYAKNNEVTFGTTGNGSDDHILMCKLNDALDLNLVQVAASGWADNNAAIQGGHIDATAGNVGEVYNAVANGDMIVLCVFSEEEDPFLPGVPTFNSLGLCEQSITNSSQRGFAVKGGTDPEIVATLEAAFEKAINNPDHIAEMAELGMLIDYIGAEEYTELMKQEEQTMIGMSSIMGWE